VIDIAAELTSWLRSTDARSLMKEIVAEAVQAEIHKALEDELIDVERAAAMLDMSPGALRKAVERGQIPCERIGSRLRFRRADLLRGGRPAIPAVLSPAASSGTRNGRRMAS
jgi:excisionase family DNA binding protein